MAKAKTDKVLAGYERRYRELAGELALIGFISSGTLLHRYTRCPNPHCRCRAEPPELHGPHWQWTAKVDGKTVTRRLSDAEAAIYAARIDNDKKLRSLIDEMRQLSTKVLEIETAGLSTSSGESPRRSRGRASAAGS
jgi:hypothetical protein